MEKFLWEYDKHELTTMMLALCPDNGCARKRKRPCDGSNANQRERLTDVGYCDGCKKKNDSLEIWYFRHPPPWKIKRREGFWHKGRYITWETKLVRSFYVCEDCLQSALSWQQVKEAESIINHLQWSMRYGRHRSS